MPCDPSGRRRRKRREPGNESGPPSTRRPRRWRTRARRGQPPRPYARAARRSRTNRRRRSDVARRRGGRRPPGRSRRPRTPWLELALARTSQGSPGAGGWRETERSPLPREPKADAAKQKVSADWNGCRVTWTRRLARAETVRRAAVPARRTAPEIWPVSVSGPRGRRPCASSSAPPGKRALVSAAASSARPKPAVQTASGDSSAPPEARGIQHPTNLGRVEVEPERLRSGMPVGRPARPARRRAARAQVARPLPARPAHHGAPKQATRRVRSRRESGASCERSVGSAGSVAAGGGVGRESGGPPLGRATGPGNRGQETEARVADGAGPNRAEVIGVAAGRGFAAPGYARVFADYQSAVEEALGSTAVPEGKRYLVRRYFDLIRPRDGGGRH